MNAPLATHPLQDRVIALAALLQAAAAVRALANTGSAPSHLSETPLYAVFQRSAATTEAVFNGLPGLRPGLRLLLGHLDGVTDRDQQELRIAATILHVERKLIRRSDMLERLGEGVENIDRQREHFGLLHPTVVSRLGDLYAETISQLKPRVLVQGNPLHLSQALVVSQVRAMLLAAMRAAVLWRQSGGSYWDLILRRRAIASCARRLLADLPAST
jgi:high frequency lysogenization protein